MTDHTDLIARLRAWKRLPAAEWHIVAAEAATALEALSQREARLREALHKIVREWEGNDISDADEWEEGYEDGLSHCARIARTALAEGGAK